MKNKIGTDLPCRRRRSAGPVSEHSCHRRVTGGEPAWLQLPSRPGEFHPGPLTDPDLNLSIHPARVTARRLPPSAEPSGSSRCDPVGPSSTAMTRPLRSTGITPASSLLRGSPPLSGASVLSASRLEPLVPFPLASPARFSRSVQEPGRASRCLHAGCRSVGIRTSTELIPKVGSTLGSDIT